MTHFELMLLGCGGKGRNVWSSCNLRRLPAKLSASLLGHVTECNQHYIVVTIHGQCTCKPQ